MTSYSELARNLDRVVRRMDAGVHGLIQQSIVVDIGPVGVLTLLTISDNAPAPLQYIADRMARDKSQITKIIKKLERRDLIARRLSNDDGRVSLIELTRKGHDWIDIVTDILSTVVTDTFQHLDQSDLKDLSRIIEKLK
ncbi:MAG: MarR family transcriptional regulator [Pseudomonadota bacterium]